MSTEIKKGQSVDTAIAVVSCHIADSIRGIDPDRLESLHCRDESLEDKIRDLVVAILESDLRR